MKLGVLPAVWRLAVAALLCVLSAAAWSAPVKSILWVGNSRTYVGNLPEVYKALVQASAGRSVKAEMLVEGGGDLQGRALDHSLRNLLEQTKYDVVLLQERGNILPCAADADKRMAGDCYSSMLAHNMLSKYGHDAGSKVLLMGTADFAENSIVMADNRLKGEAWMAFTAKLDGHIQLARAVWSARQAEPKFAWVHADGMHQGRDSLLLMAVLTYNKLEGQWPRAKALDMNLRDYSADMGFGADKLGSEQNTELPLSHIKVSAKHLARIIDIAQKTPPY